MSVQLCPVSYFFASLPPGRSLSALLSSSVLLFHCIRFLPGALSRILHLHSPPRLDILLARSDDGAGGSFIRPGSRRAPAEVVPARFQTRPRPTFLRSSLCREGRRGSRKTLNFERGFVLLCFPTLISDNFSGDSGHPMSSHFAGPTDSPSRDSWKIPPRQ